MEGACSCVCVLMVRVSAWVWVVSHTEKKWLVPQSFGKMAHRAANT